MPPRITFKPTPKEIEVVESDSGVPVEVVQPRRKLGKRLSELLDDGDLELAVETIRGGLKANKSHWDGVAKQMVIEPDFKIRMDAAKTVLAYKEGMPVQRQVVIAESFESLREAIAAATHSPEAMRLIESGLLAPSLENGTAPHRNA
jgi:hypothetical protein